METMLKRRYSLHSLDKKKSWMGQSNKKMMVVFDWKGLVHHEFIPRGQTVNKEYYRKVLKRLREAVCKIGASTLSVYH